ncbi:hypothetical protein C8A05DRAFT_17680 [Staphylotrichum tortipilum]|uniref:LITAF domain-containing protein n=1 Tax=Staphylotrichum tortipilum TaxID=2831512 RepID=A0AAN6MGU4_9PEZI|nr:hypothetical protein C8A05DRAFT_17680 [Staphylotrichum longicolle]
MAYKQQNPPVAAGLQDAPLPVDKPPAPVKGLPVNLDSAQQPVTEVTSLNRLGDEPQSIDCPFCERRATTRLDHRRTAMQFFYGLLCFLGCPCLTCIGCAIHAFENTNYYCSECDKKVATRPNDGPITVYTPGGPVVEMTKARRATVKD